MRLELLAKDCNYQAVSVIEHRNQATLVAFVSGLDNPGIRQRLLDTEDLTLLQAVTKAEILQRDGLRREWWQSQRMCAVVIQSFQKMKIRWELLQMLIAGNLNRRLGRAETVVFRMHKFARRNV